MASLVENITQAIADFDDIKAAIIEKGVSVPDGTRTSQYGDLIRQISGGGTPIIYGIEYTDNYVLRGSSASATYKVVSERERRLDIAYPNWGAILMKDFYFRGGESLTLRYACWTNFSSQATKLTASAYIGFFEEEEFDSITKDNPRWTLIEETTSTDSSLKTKSDLRSQKGYLCFMCIHGDEVGSYTTFLFPQALATG